MTGDLLLIDGGTTNTRAYAVRGQDVLARARAMVGVRDTAKDGSTTRLAHAVRNLLDAVATDACRRDASWQPAAVIAAGMITSPLGLVDVPHVAAPAGAADLAAAAVDARLPAVTTLPAVFIPGVRCGPDVADAETLPQVDVMRGEESLCLGLAALGFLEPCGVMLNLGSHWKLIELSRDGRIQASATTLGGELLYALQTQTVLAASVESDPPHTLDVDAVTAGVREHDRSGLPRAAFCTRLLERVPASSPRSRLSFLVGVVIGATLAGWRARLAGHAITLVGAGGLVEAWEAALARIGCTVRTVGEADAERALITGLTTIARLHEWRA